MSELAADNGVDLAPAYDAKDTDDGVADAAAQQPTSCGAWNVFRRLVDEHEELAALVVARLPRNATKALHGSCRTLRCLINDSVTTLNISAEDVVHGRPLRETFRAVRTVTFRQGTVPDAAYAGMLKQQLLHLRLGPQLVNLRLNVAADQGELYDGDDALYAQLAGVWSRLPRLRTLSIYRELGDPVEHLAPSATVDVAPLAAGATYATGLTRLALDTLVLDTAAALPAAHLQRLRVLTVWACPMWPNPNTICDAIGRLRELACVELSVEDTKVDFDGSQLGHLAALPRLRSLLVHNQLLAVGYAALGKLTQLTRLVVGSGHTKFNCHEFHNEAYYLTSLRSLRHLELRQWTVCDRGIAVLALPHLTRLLCHIHDYEEDFEGGRRQRDIAVTSTLRSLEVGFSTTSELLTEVGLARLQPAGHPSPLEILDGWGFVTCADVLALAHYAQLHVLKLPALAATVDDACFCAAMPQLKLLKTLEIQGLASITGKGIAAALEGLTQLTDVTLSDAPQVGELGLLVLAKLPLLEELTLKHFPLITAQLIQTLQEQLPNCIIIWKD